MSHVTEVKAADGTVMEFNDLSALNEAIELGCPQLELVQQSEYRGWKTDYGKLAGDYPLPAGMTEEEVGKNATAVIRLKKEFLPAACHGKRDSGPYEIGIVANKDKPGTYKPVVDFFAQGNGLFNAPGVGKVVGSHGEGAMSELYMYYQMSLVKREAQRRGQQFTATRQSDGSYVGRIRA